jgi:hypothetical protein
MQAWNTETALMKERRDSPPKDNPVNAKDFIIPYRNLAGTLDFDGGYRWKLTREFGGEAAGIN